MSAIKYGSHRLRRPFRAPRAGAVKRRGSSGDVQTLSVNSLRAIICGLLFVLLVGLKLLLPDAMAQTRATLGNWLVRDADFVSAFSAVGHAVSGEGGVLDSLGDAYVAVFGTEEATEVMGGAEVEAEENAIEKSTELPEREAPEHVALGQRVLGFDYAAPLKGEITSPFGWREHPLTGRETFHYGVDIAAEEGAEVTCFADGTVGVVGDSVELGKYLTVHHENGILTLYGHCGRITAVSGAKVALGDKLAEAGSTGNATGVHLHFEIREGEDYIDPIYYLNP